MGIEVYSGPELEWLFDRFAAKYREDPGDPFLPLAVGVPTDGVGRWLSLRLADTFGVAANLKLESPGSLLSSLPEAWMGGKGMDEDRVLWAIYELLIGGFPERPAAERLKSYLEGKPSRVFPLARKIGDLFDQYQNYRPDWVKGWEEGRRFFPENPDEGWQAELWCALVEKYGRVFSIHRRETLLSTIDSLPAEELSRVFGRINLFGLTTLTPHLLRTYLAISRKIPVCCFIPSARRPGEGISENPFLETSSRLSHELLSELSKEKDARLIYPEGFFQSPGMLGEIRTSLMEASYRPQKGLPDETVAIAGCSGRLREVEVLRDHLVEWVRNEKLPLSGIAVFAPEIEEYVPLIHAVFGDGAIPYSIADRKPVAESRLARAWISILELMNSDLTYTELSSLLLVPEIQESFDLTAEESLRLLELLREAGARWGLDSPSVQAAGYPGETRFTWQDAVDRMILGLVMSPSDSGGFGRILPEERAASADGLEHFLAFFQSVRETVSLGQESRTPGAWAEKLASILSSFFKRQRDDFEYRAVERTLRKLALASGDFSGELEAPIVVEFLRTRLDYAGGENAFLRGGVTFCSLLPMRSVPFEAIAVLGLNDLDFPRRPEDHELDLTRLETRPLDRNIRLGDRELFLQTLLSARKKLYLSYQSRRESDHSEREPSVLLSELSEFVGEKLGAAIKKVEYPLAAHSRKYILASETDFRTASPEDFRAGLAILSGRKERLETGPSVPEPVEAGDIELSELIEFYLDPPKYLYRKRLGVYYDTIAPLGADEETLEPDQLERYRTLTEYFESVRLPDREGFFRKLLDSGRLPPGRMGEAKFEEWWNGILGVKERLETFRQGVLPPFHAELPVEGRRRLRMTLAPRNHEELLIFRPTGGIKAFDRVRLCLSGWAAASVHAPFSVRWMGLKEEQEAPGVLSSAPEKIRELVRVFDDHRSEPLWFLPGLGEAYLKLIGKKVDRLSALRNIRLRWDSDSGWDSLRDASPYHAAFAESGWMNDPEHPSGIEFARISELFFGGEEEAR